jgi:integrase
MSSAIDTPAKRRKIPAGKAPIWAAIGGARGGLKVGYRKGVRGGVWIAKAVGAKQRRETTLGRADDDNAGFGALSFRAATVAALDWAGLERARRINGAGDQLHTVASAVTEYIATRERRDTRCGRDARSRLTKHVLSDKRLAALPLGRVTVKELRAWSTRTGVTLASATLNRLQNDLRAALNAAVEVYPHEFSPTARQDIAAGLRARPDADQIRQVILIDADVRTVIDASLVVDADFGALVLVLAATGCRFSQAAALTVRDLQIEARRILVPSSRKGRSAKARPQIAVPVGDDVIDQLKLLIAGRAGHEPLLQRWISRQTGPFTWERVRRAPWSSASEMTRAWARALAQTNVSAGTPPCALRHSSIVRALRAGVPVQITAALHDTSSAMIEKHYAAHILDFSHDLARLAVTSLVSPPTVRFQSRSDASH